MIYLCPECQEVMEYMGGATDLVRSLHLYACENCKIELQKEVQSLYPIDEHHVH